MSNLQVQCDLCMYYRASCDCVILLVDSCDLRVCVTCARTINGLFAKQRRGKVPRELHLLCGGAP